MLTLPDHKKKEIAVVLPAYNEEATIALTLEAFVKEVPQAYFVVVNNNSSDQTEQIAQDTIDRLGIFGKVITEGRQGKGNAMRRAFMEVDTDIYVLVDADLTYPAESVHMLLKPVIEGKADMVVGDRHSQGYYSEENKRFLHGFGNGLVSFLVNTFFSTNLKDIMSGYRVFNRRFIKNYPILVEGFEIETDLTLYALDRRFRIMEIPISYKDRPEGSFSKLNTFSDGARVLFTIASILRHYKPFVFFGAFALLFFLLGLLAGFPVLQDWFEDRYISHVPLAILATGV